MHDDESERALRAFTRNFARAFGIRALAVAREQRRNASGEAAERWKAIEQLLVSEAGSGDDALRPAPAPILNAANGATPKKDQAE